MAHSPTRFWCFTVYHGGGQLSNPRCSCVIASTFLKFIVNALLLYSIGLSRPCAIRPFGRSSHHARDYWLSPNKKEKKKETNENMRIYMYITPKKGTTITVHFKLDCHRAYNIELSTTTSIGYSFPAINVPKKYRRLYADALYNVIVTTCLLWHNDLAVRLTDVNTLQYEATLLRAGCVGAGSARRWHGRREQKKKKKSFRMARWTQHAILQLM